MFNKKITLMLLAFSLPVISLISCTTGSGAPIFPNGKSTEVKPVDFTLRLDITVWTSDNEPAYPSRVYISAVRILRNGNKVDLVSSEKYVQRNGAVPIVEFVFKRVYPEDDIRYTVTWANETLWKTGDIYGTQIATWAKGKTAYTHEVREFVKFSITLQQFQKNLSIYQ